MKSNKISDSKYIHPTNIFLAKHSSRISFIYSVLWAMLAYFPGYFDGPYSTISYITLITFLIFGIVRKIHCGQVESIPPRVWRKTHVILNISNALLWTSVASTVLIVEGVSVVSFAWLMTIAGLVSGGVAYMAVLPQLAITYLTILIIPVIGLVLGDAENNVVNYVGMLVLFYWLQMTLLAKQIGIQHKENLTNQFKLEDYSDKLKRLSDIDSLTQIANRRCFENKYKIEWLRAKRLKSPLSLIMIDLDLFKTVNDNYGHQAGDLCIQELANILKNYTKRPTDLAARYGGEEFILLLPETDELGAADIAEKIRLSMESLDIHYNNQVIKLTLSAGVNTIVPCGEGNCQRSFLKYTDDALYQAKKLGRNQVCKA